MIKTRFIFNPRSGHNAKNPHLLERARTFIREHSLDADVVLTERPLHATRVQGRQERLVKVQRGGGRGHQEVRAVL